MSEYNIQMNKYNALNAEYDQLYPATKIANVDGLDTALQKKAPAGYGWGDANNYTFYTNDEFKEWFMQNAAPKCFRNTFAASVYIGDIYNYRMLIIASGDYSTSGIVILGYTYNGHELRATINDYGIWGPWEWVNPPMEPGKEYRTTERYLGKPVYAKAINFGVLTNASASSASFNVNQTVFRPIDFGGIAVKNDGSISYALTSHGNNISENDIALNVFGSSAWIKTSGDCSDFTATVWVKYYKSTD